MLGKMLVSQSSLPAFVLPVQASLAELLLPEILRHLVLYASNNNGMMLVEVVEGLVGLFACDHVLLLTLVVTLCYTAQQGT